MPVSDASVSALKNISRSLVMAIAWRLHNRNWQNSKKQLADPAFRARAQGLAAVDSGMAGKAIPELQQAVRANPKDSEALGALGRAYSQKGDRANAVANLEKALATGSAQQQQRQMEQSPESKPLLAGDPAGRCCAESQ